MKKKIYLLAAGVFLSVMQLAAQKMTHSYQHWYTYFGTAQLSKHWSIPFDVQARIRNGISDKGQILTRAGLQYMPGKRAGYTLGYAYVTTFSDPADAWFPEHRIYQQFSYKHDHPGFDMTHRVRFEQRWVGQKTATHNEDVEQWNFGTRLRYFNRTQILFRKDGTPTQFYLALQNEFFMNLWNNAINDKFIDQNRFYVAPGYALQPNLKLEAGYMNHYVQSPSGSQSMNHILQLSMLHTFSL